MHVRVCVSKFVHAHRFDHAGLKCEYSQYVGRLILCSSVHLFLPLLFSLPVFCRVLLSACRIVLWFVVAVMNQLLLLMALVMSSAITLMHVKLSASFVPVMFLLMMLAYCWCDVHVGWRWPCCCSLLGCCCRRCYGSCRLDVLITVLMFLLFENCDLTKWPLLRVNLLIFFLDR